MGIRSLDSSVLDGSMKRCAKCKELKPVTRFGRNRHARDGKHYWCKDCLNAHNREKAEKRKKRWADKVPSRKGLKRCSRCREEKPKTEFHLNRRRYDGLSNECKVCSSLKFKRLYVGERRLTIKFKALRRNAESRGIKFSLTYEEFCNWDSSQGSIDERRCLICNRSIKESKEFQRQRGKRKLCGFTVDRIDSQQGYSLDNLQMLCYICNAAKGQWFTTEEMRRLGPILDLLQRQALGLGE